MLIKVDFLKMGRAGGKLHFNKAISPSIGRGVCGPDWVFSNVCVFLYCYPCENHFEPFRMGVR